MSARQAARQILLAAHSPEMCCVMRSVEDHQFGVVCNSSYHQYCWQARIEALAAKLAGDAPSPKPPARGTERAIVHIDMDCFFASVAGGLITHDTLRAKHCMTVSPDTEYLLTVRTCMCT